MGWVQYDVTKDVVGDMLSKGRGGVTSVCPCSIAVSSGVAPAEPHSWVCALAPAERRRLTATALPL